MEMERRRGTTSSPSVKALAASALVGQSQAVSQSASQSVSQSVSGLPTKRLPPGVRAADLAPPFTLLTRFSTLLYVQLSNENPRSHADDFLAPAGFRPGGRPAAPVNLRCLSTVSCGNTSPTGRPSVTWTRAGVAFANHGARGRLRLRPEPPRESGRAPLGGRPRRRASLLSRICYHWLCDVRGTTRRKGSGQASHRYGPERRGRDLRRV